MNERRNQTPKHNYQTPKAQIKTFPFLRILSHQFKTKNMKRLILALAIIGNAIISIAQSHVELDTLNESTFKYKLYYENGQLEEEGYWSNGKNIGEFKRYHENGNLAQAFNFNKEGRRFGVQRYFYSNGNIQFIGNWEEGKISGKANEFDELGQVEETKLFIDGKLYSKI